MAKFLFITYSRYTDMESEDYSFYQGLVFLLEHDVKELGYELTFSVEVSISLYSLSQKFKHYQKMLFIK